MRLAILSDLHLEFEPFIPPGELRRADVVVLAGDIHNGIAALQWARRSFPNQPIVQIAGNHEFFGGCWQPVQAQMRRVARELGIHFLENDAIVIDGIQFLGATLWTDYELFSVPGKPLQMSADEVKPLIQQRMIDYSLIRWRDDGDAADRLLTPDDSIGLHRRSRNWLADQLAIPFVGLRVVVSHHLPSWRSVAPEFLRATSNAAFASDLDSMFKPVAMWIHGHTHHSFDYLAGSTRVIANPRGYPMKVGGFENPAFEPALVAALGS